MINLEQRPVRRALISVSDKTGIVDFAKALHEKGVEILSTGGTAKLLIEEFIPVKEVSKHTGFPEIMDGRVKTLHPKIHGGLLARRGIDDEVMSQLGTRITGWLGDSDDIRAVLTGLAGREQELYPGVAGDGLQTNAAHAATRKATRPSQRPASPSSTEPTT